MELHLRHAYNDVTLLASSDQEASKWMLDVLSDDGWCAVPSKLMDSRLNWSTPDVEVWEELRTGGAEVFGRLFPDALATADSSSIEVMWDVSPWVYGRMSRAFRFTDPNGIVHEFDHRWDMDVHVFD